MVQNFIFPMHMVFVYSITKHTHLRQGMAAPFQPKPNPRVVQSAELEHAVPSHGWRYPRAYLLILFWKNMLCGHRCRVDENWASASFYSNSWCFQFLGGPEMTWTSWDLLQVLHAEPWKIEMERAAPVTGKPMDKVSCKTTVTLNRTQPFSRWLLERLPHFSKKKLLNPNQNMWHQLYN